MFTRTLQGCFPVHGRPVLSNRIDAMTMGIDQVPSPRPYAIYCVVTRTEMSKPDKIAGHGILKGISCYIATGRTTVLGIFPRS